MSKKPIKTVSLETAAEMLGVKSPSYFLKRAGIKPHNIVGNSYYYPLSEVEALVIKREEDKLAKIKALETSNPSAKVTKAAKEDEPTWKKPAKGGVTPIWRAIKKLEKQVAALEDIITRPNNGLKL